ncbi:BZIP transcription factor [Coniochaeta hoffmannii]|uniref:BZIP transcription factor n=1 Tax=Coniochaeta hoffmannii TaxID=91930 RepID=A0AA38RKB1_9PEZI|nr:BZIP transcription factor [Coniochaeta hoffmannii]
MSIEKEDLSKDHSGDESTGSSPEAETQQNSSNNNAPQENQQPKRKGGRKPIYATSEERKQRNRQAQAAFRERRTEYIKQLEETIRVHEQNLHNLQTAHRHAADECLMLRYKNSLLERILLEKGIDVQAELRAKTGSPTLGPTHMPQNMIQPPPIHRALLNRHHARRSNSSIAPKLEPGVVAGPLPPPLQSPHALATGASPKNRPTPPSHTASPTTTTPYSSQHGASPATSGSDHMTGQVRHPQHPTNNSMKAPPIPVGNMAAAGTAPAARHMQHMARPQPTAGAPQVSGGVSAAPFYATQAYQNHLEQLEQEYDAAADMIDDHNDAPDTPSGPGPYPGAQYGGEPQPMSLPSPVTTMPPTSQHMTGQSPMEGVQHQQQHHHHVHHHQQQQPPQHQQQQGQQQQGGGYPSMTQLLDPALDWDPFGLSASMAFPAQFSFDTSNMR